MANFDAAHHDCAAVEHRQGRTATCHNTLEPLHVDRISRYHIASQPRNKRSAASPALAVPAVIAAAIPLPSQTIATQSPAKPLGPTTISKLDAERPAIRRSRMQC